MVDIVMNRATRRPPVISRALIVVMGAAVSLLVAVGAGSCWMGCSDDGSGSSGEQDFT